MRRSDGKISSSYDIYEALSPHYREYSESRGAYLEAVDRILIRDMPRGATSLLDVGAGDGVRASRIARAREISTWVLAEPCEAMVLRCREKGASEVWPVAAEQLPEAGGSFDVITCLWNVLGHLPNHDARVRALTRMRGLMAKNGVIFFDVNNRYNARSYGWLTTLGRIVYDRIHPSESNGDVSFEWHVDGKRISSRGHLFTPGEADRLIRGAGLAIVQRYVVDYRNGERRRTVFEGQLLYEVRQEAVRE